MFSACQRTTRCQSVSSRHSPDCWSFTLRLVARVKLVTDEPEGVNLVSASRPRCPSRITLLALLPAMVNRTLPHCALRRSRRCPVLLRRRMHYFGDRTRLTLLQQSLCFVLREQRRGIRHRLLQQTRRGSAG